MADASKPLKVAVIGTGIAGLTVANGLKDQAELLVFERNDHIGGHTHTHSVTHEGVCYAIDTGFIVFNDWTYPAFIALLDTLGVDSKPSTMSFSVRCDRTGLEYNGTNFNALFAQRRNLFSPRFIGMILDILRFNKSAPTLLDEGQKDWLLGDYLRHERYGQAFIDHYILPMGAAVWSTSTHDMLQFPARFFVQFFLNHGMLSVDRRPTWRVISGGSKSYVEALVRPFQDSIRTNTAVAGVRRFEDHVVVRTAEGQSFQVDQVVLACHSDEALSLLEDPSDDERQTLGALKYQANEAVLHTDTRLLPQRRLAWASWNYQIPKTASDRVTVTYNMNLLQGIEAPVTFCVSLNPASPIDPSKVIRQMTYHHPLFTLDSMAAQRRHSQISGLQRTYYAGAYWGYGFHEDGVKSGLEVLNQLQRNYLSQR